MAMLIFILCVGRLQADAFRDRDLNALLKISKNNDREYLIYAWSPHMPLSVRGLADMRMQIPENVTLVPLLDPNADVKFTRRFMAERGWEERDARPIEATQLIRKGIRLHYPNQIFVSGGRLRTLIPGYKSYDRLRELDAKSVSAPTPLRAPASLARQICTPDSAFTPTQRIYLSGGQQFFIRPSEATQEIGYRDVSQNRILGVDTGADQTLPGAADAVPTPDGKYIVGRISVNYLAARKRWFTDDQVDAIQPNFRPRYAVGGGYVIDTSLDGKVSNKFMKTKLTVADLIARGEDYSSTGFVFYRRPNLEVAFIDYEMNGEYQSVGRLNGPVGADRYRLLYEAPGGLQYRDYSFNGRQVTTSSITRVCPAARDGTLPLLSKDGTLFGTYLASEGRSKIFSTTSTDDACGPIATLPMLTGKMDFSPDNSKVAFHVDLLTDEIMFMDPTRKNKMAALLYDLNTRAASVIRDIPGQQSFYPVFLRNDRLALVNRDVHDEGYGMYSLLVGGLHAPNRATCAECTDERAPIGKFSMVLGLMYQAFCASGDRSLRAAKANVVKMNRAQCRSLISQFVDADLRGHGQDAQRLLVDAGQSFTSRIDRGNLRRVCERF